MLSWALRYLVMAVGVAIGFAALQGVDWLGPPGKAHIADEQAGRDGRAAGDRSQRARVEPGAHGLLELVIPAGPQGHFVVDAEVEGTPLTFLIDTGATDVVLSQGDARRLGLEPRGLDYSVSYRTANGIVRAAPVRLRELRLGELHLYDLEASVNEGPMPMSLLGMSFLGRLEGYEVADGRLVLRW